MPEAPFPGFPAAGPGDMPPYYPAPGTRALQLLAEDLDRLEGLWHTMRREQKAAFRKLAASIMERQFPLSAPGVVFPEPVFPSTVYSPGLWGRAPSVSKPGARPFHRRVAADPQGYGARHQSRRLAQQVGARYLDRLGRWSPEAYAETIQASLGGPLKPFLMGADSPEKVGPRRSPGVLESYEKPFVQRFGYLYDPYPEMFALPRGPKPPGKSTAAVARMVERELPARGFRGAASPKLLGGMAAVAALGLLANQLIGDRD